jgi:hypothetical protein
MHWPPCGISDGRYNALLQLDGAPDAAALQQARQLRPLLAAAIGEAGPLELLGRSGGWPAPLAALRSFASAASFHTRTLQCPTLSHIFFTAKKQHDI